MKQIVLIFNSLFMYCLFTTFACSQQPYYVGGSIGQSNVEEHNVLSGEDFDGEDFAYKVFAGKRLHKNIAAEFSYIDYGEPDDDVLGIDTEIDLHAFAVYVLGIVPLSDQFELFAKLGGARWEETAKAEFMGITARTDENGTDIAYGVGALFSFTNQFAVRVEFEALDVDDEIDTVEKISIGGQFHF